ncbi:MAG: alpha/beta hydrolase [Pseudomonadota bacterium]
MKLRSVWMAIGLAHLLCSPLVGLAQTTMPVTFASVLEIPSRSPDRVHKYGQAPSQFAQLWLPSDSSDRKSVVVLIHGGCWLSDYSIDHIGPLATALAGEGFAVWAPEYRRVGERGGGWPGTFADAQRAIDHLIQVPELEPYLSNTLLVGHSAGGHIALWLASRPKELRPQAIVVRGAVGLAAITDLVSYANGSNSCELVTPKLLGGTPEQFPNRYEKYSPARLQTNVSTSLLRGDQDRIVGEGQVSAMTATPSQTLDGAGHFDWIHPQTPAFDVLVAELLAVIGS